MNDLYLIGNGFDLAHGLETSYNDFLLWYLKKAITGTNQQYYFEDDLLEIKGDALCHLKKDHKSIKQVLNIFNQQGLSINYKHDFFKKIIKNYSGNKWVDIEYEYYLALIDLYKRLERTGLSNDNNIDKELESLNNCFGLIMKKLKEYLSNIDIQSVRGHKLIGNILTENTGTERTERNDLERNVGEKLFLNFNYTSTLDLYSEEFSFFPSDKIYIHGKLNNPDNPIIFGYGDEIDPHYEKIENLNNNEFLKNIKSFSYFKTDNYQKIIRFIEGTGREFTVKILGHSCGLSDRILLNTIFEHPNCKHIKIFHYEKSPDENDYFEKTQEISRHFKASSKGEMRMKIVPFDRNSALPQNLKDN
ncbi:MAG: AbiH family protein [Prolixibacteraceae bacterium]